MLVINEFNILERELDICQNYLLEASAGTGKTFSIENLVVRLLLESSNTIDQILIVTFTRAATKELKTRVRQSIFKACEFFKQCANGHVAPNCPDFLLFHIEQGPDKVASAKRSLEQALLNFEEAQIFTIHSFCQQMLSDQLFAGGSLNSSEDLLLSGTELLQVVRDFFRIKLNSPAYSPGQLQIVLKQHRYHIENLEAILCREVKRGITLAEEADFPTLLQEFVKLMQLLKSEGFSSKTIMADFLALAPCYYGVCDRNKAVSSSIVEKIKWFAGLFDQESWSAKEFDRLLLDKLVIVDLLTPAQKKPKSQLPDPKTLFHPHLVERLKVTLEPLLKRAGGYLVLLGRMTRDCQIILENYLSEVEKYRYDDLLKALLQAVKEYPELAENIRKKYHAVIVDEFQDTDAVQWYLFKTLFLTPKSKNFLYLVGDPKQSIYGFRQADIYTYLQASKDLGASARASLTTNYRSQPSLVHALNVLFSTENAPGFLALPRFGQSLKYQPVHANSKAISKEFSDAKGAVHFFLAEGKQGRADNWPTPEIEEKFLFPFIVNEMQQLHKNQAIAFKQWAILVRDRFQADRLALYCKKRNIPTLLQRQEQLLDSTALHCLKELLEGVLQADETSSLKKALAGRIIGWTHHDLRKLSDELLMTQVAKQMHHLRKILVEEGFAPFFQELLQSSWHPDEDSVAERLLRQSGGIDFYTDLQQIAEILMEQQCQGGGTAHNLVSFLEDFQLLELNEDERSKRRQDENRDAVRILTIHASKGLEFDFVVPLGLLNRTSSREEFTPIDTPQGRQLKAVGREDPSFLRYTQELDAEKMRQLYVAMTRAKYRLYLPAIFSLDKKPIEPGEASPMELFLAYLAKQEKNLYRHIQEMAKEPFCDLLTQLGKEANITHSVVEETVHPGPLQEERSSLKWQVLQIPIIPGKAHYVHSFSTLARTQIVEHSLLPTVVSPPHDFEASVKTAHTLPAGNQTGTLLHTILETLSFEAVKQMQQPHELIPHVNMHVQGTPFFSWNQVIAERVFAALKASIQVDEGFFHLCDISSARSYKEMEFLHPLQQADYLKGVMDLVFEWAGKYYILDWKSNWLGESDVEYSQQHLERAVRQHAYDLQASIYTEALRKYLKVVESRPFEECFGGCLYLFLRGVQPNSSHGIYHIK